MAWAQPCACLNCARVVLVYSLWLILVPTLHYCFWADKLVAKHTVIRNNFPCFFKWLAFTTWENISWDPNGRCTNTQKKCFGRTLSQSGLQLFNRFTSGIRDGVLLTAEPDIYLAAGSHMLDTFYMINIPFLIAERRLAACVPSVFQDSDLILLVLKWVSYPENTLRIAIKYIM